MFLLFLVVLLASMAIAPLVNANDIIDENSKIGTPQSVWDVGPGSDAIRGFTDNISYSPGNIVRFKVDTGSGFSIELYRIGYYQGNGARKIDTVRGTQKLQPACLHDSSGLFDCGNWSVSATWRVPQSTVSGVYIGKLIRDDTGEASHVIFVVRDDTHNSDIIIQTSDETWQAYNEYGGGSLYRNANTSTERAFKVSYNRPFIWRNSSSYAGVSNFFNSEYPLIRWIEKNGYSVSYISSVDTARYGNLIKNHKIFVSSGHDEYWAGQQRANVEAARDSGVNLAFFSGNEMFWKTRWAASMPPQLTQYRTLVCYKETLAGQTIDPRDPPIWTGTWRDPTFSPPADGGRPENALTGTLFMVNGIRGDDLTVTSAYSQLPFWRGTAVADLSPGASITLGASLLGFEWDEDINNGFRPLRLTELSATPVDVPAKLIDNGGTYAPGRAVHSLTLYRAPSGALVFGAGTGQWAWGLDSTHDNNAGLRVSGPDMNVQKATKNLFADMGVVP